MNKPEQALLLGPSPAPRGVGRWILAGCLTYGAWQFYQVAPLPGLVAVGLAPFVNMYLFFRGLSLVVRGIPYWKTKRLARRLQLEPDWGCADGGYLLVDENKGVWVANGLTGELPHLARLTCRLEQQAFYLDLHEDPEAPPVVSVGLSGFERLNAVAERLRQAALRYADTSGKTAENPAGDQGEDLAGKWGNNPGCGPAIVPLKIGD